MATPNPTKLEDRGTYWIVTYDDGGYDNIPKDPTVLDTAATSNAVMGKPELAAKFRMWAQNIRTKGVPVILPSNATPLLILGGVAILGIFWMFRKGMR